MAIQFNAVGEFLSRSTGTFLSTASDFSYCYWLRTDTALTPGGGYRVAHSLCRHAVGALLYSDGYLFEGTAWNAGPARCVVSRVPPASASESARMVESRTADSAARTSYWK